MEILRLLVVCLVTSLHYYTQTRTAGVRHVFVGPCYVAPDVTHNIHQQSVCSVIVSNKYALVCISS